MIHVCFMTRVKRTTDGTWDKGVEVKERATDKEAYNAARQSFHAYLGSYAYGNKEGVDYVHVSISNLAGLELNSETWDNIAEEPVEEIIEEPTEEPIEE